MSKKKIVFLFFIGYFIFFLVQKSFEPTAKISRKSLKTKIKIHGKKTVSFVSAFYDISRKERPNEVYYQWLNNTIKINTPIIFFTSQNLKKKIEILFDGKIDITIIALDIQQSEYFYDTKEIKRILRNNTYKSKMQDSNRIECSNPLYSIIQFSKFFFLKKAGLINPYHSEKFIWIDAGISRFFGNFNLKNEITGKKLNMEKFYVLIDYRRALKNQLFKKKLFRDVLWSSSNFFVGGIMGGSFKSILKVDKELKKIWLYMLKNQIINNEQIGLSLVYFLNQEYFFLLNRTNTNSLEEFLNFLI